MSRQEKKQYYVVHTYVKHQEGWAVYQGDILESKDEGKTLSEVMKKKEVKLSEEVVQYIKEHGEITKEEYLLLIAIDSPEKRFKLFDQERGNLKLGGKAINGTAVKVRIKMNNLTRMINGKIRWVGTFDGCESKKHKPGQHFGVELESPVGDSNGELKINCEKKGFICAENYGIYVNIQKIIFPSQLADSGSDAVDIQALNLPAHNPALDPDEPGGYQTPTDQPDDTSYAYPSSLPSTSTSSSVPAKNCFIKGQRVYFLHKGECASGKIKWMGPIEDNNETIYAGIKLKNGDNIYIPCDCLSIKEFLEPDLTRQYEFRCGELEGKLETANAEKQAMTSEHQELKRLFESNKKDLTAQTNLAKDLLKSQKGFWPKRGWIRFRRCCCCTLEEPSQ